MAGKKKIVKVQVLRLVIQILFLLPGLFINSLLGIRIIYQGVLQQDFNFYKDFAAVVAAFAIIPVTLLIGRFFCGWMCSFGAMGDWLYALSKKVFHVKFKINRKIDTILRFAKFVILILLFIVVWNIKFEFLNSINPWNAFGSIVTVTKVPDIGYAVRNFSIGTILLLLIMAGSMLVERFFCRYLCPLGALFAVLSKCRIITINKPGKDCGACKVCTNKCAMGIPLYEMEKVRSGECIQCLKCVTECPRNNAQVAIANNELNPGLAGAMAVVAMTGIYYTAGAISDAVVNAGYSSESSSNQTQSGKYNDGTYEGIGEGFRGATTKVSVTIKDGNITDITVISYGDDAPYFNRAFSSIKQEIISSQSTEVDAVSGATYSSNGIINAVADALGKAGASDEFAKKEAAEVITGEGVLAQASVSTEALIQASENPAATASTQITAQSSGSEVTAQTSSSGTTAQSSSGTTSQIASSSGSTGQVTSSSGSTGQVASNSGSTGQATSSSGTTSQTVLNQETGQTTSDTKVDVAVTEQPDEVVQVTESPVTPTEDNSTDDVTSGYTDGTYTGTGSGFRGGTTKLNVTISNGLITDIQVVSYHDDAPYFNRAYSYVVSEIISSQSTDVDAVSGATYSSRGIMEAVADALNKS